jgi:hypothetical protein
VALYEKHNPPKVADVDRLLDKFHGREQDVLDAARRKYEGAESSSTNSTRTSTSSSTSTSSTTQFLGLDVLDSVLPGIILKNLPSSSTTSSTNCSKIQGTKGEQQGRTEQQGQTAQQGRTEKQRRAEQEVGMGTHLVGGTHREQLIGIYCKHNPEKLADVDRLLKKYEGQESKLVAIARRKYCPE